MIFNIRRLSVADVCFDIVITDMSCLIVITDSSLCCGLFFRCLLCLKTQRSLGHMFISGIYCVPMLHGDVILLAVSVMETSPGQGPFGDGKGTP